MQMVDKLLWSKVCARDAVGDEVTWIRLPLAAASKSRSFSTQSNPSPTHWVGPYLALGNEGACSGGWVVVGRITP